MPKLMMYPVDSWLDESSLECSVESLTRPDLKYISLVSIHALNMELVGRKLLAVISCVSWTHPTGLQDTHTGANIEGLFICRKFSD